MEEYVRNFQFRGKLSEYIVYFQGQNDKAYG